MALFDTTSITAIALGVGGAAAFFALHRLRVQPGSKTIATLLFWREAVQQQKTRVLTGKFNHPLTYLLLVAITALLALSLVGDRWSGSTAAEPTVIVIDTGYAMAATNSNGQSRLAEAQRRASGDASRSGDVSLIAAGTQARLLSTFDAPRSQFDDQLDRLQPGSSPSDSASALQLAFSLLGTDHGQVIWYTDQSAVPASLPPAIAGRIKVEHLDAAATDAAIIGVSYEPKAADTTNGLLRVRVGATADIKASLSLKATSSTGSSQTVNVPAGAQADVLIGNVAADGSTWSLQLAGAPGPAGNDAVSVTLPRRSAMTFRFHGNAPEPIRAALLAVGTEAQGESPATVEVVLDRAAAPANAQAILRLITTGNALLPAAATLELAAGVNEALSLDSITLAAGPVLTEEKMTPVLQSGDAVIAATGQVETRRELLLSSALWEAGSTLPRKPVFPVLMQRLTQQLAGWSDAIALRADRVQVDPLWQPGSTSTTLVYPQPVEATVTSSASTTPSPATTTEGKSWPVLELLLAAALTLLTAEGLLLAARKIV